MHNWPSSPGKTAHVTVISGHPIPTCLSNSTSNVRPAWWASQTARERQSYLRLLMGLSSKLAPFTLRTLPSRSFLQFAVDRLQGLLVSREFAEFLKSEILEPRSGPCTQVRDADGCRRVGRVAMEVFAAKVFPQVMDGEKACGRLKQCRNKKKNKKAKRWEWLSISEQWKLVGDTVFECICNSMPWSIDQLPRSDDLKFFKLKPLEEFSSLNAGMSSIVIIRKWFTIIVVEHLYFPQKQNQQLKTAIKFNHSEIVKENLMNDLKWMEWHHWEITDVAMILRNNCLQLVLKALARIYL